MSIFILVDRFNILMDDWSALSESERRDAVLNLLPCSRWLRYCVFNGLHLGAASHRMAVVFDNVVTGAAIWRRLPLIP